VGQQESIYAVPLARVNRLDVHLGDVDHEVIETISPRCLCWYLVADCVIKALVCHDPTVAHSL
jgi:hypothetical protein